MVIIIANKDAKNAETLLRGAPLQYMCRGEGTASSEILDYLGIGSTGKTVILSMFPSHYIPEILERLSRELRFDKPGKGIAFTFPVSGASLFLMRLASDDARQAFMKHMERNVSQMAEHATHSMIMAIINQGYSEEVMAAAKKAGAGGGTVLHARRLGAEDAMKRWGIAIQEEKELVLILAAREKKLAIMKAIGEECGLQSEAQGVTISIPVDAVVGFEKELY